MSWLNRQIELWSVQRVEDGNQYAAWTLSADGIWVDGVLITGHDISINIDRRSVVADNGRINIVPEERKAW
jgi:hypothetical protein